MRVATTYVLALQRQRIITTRSTANTRCVVCGNSVSRAHGVHPTCRPAAGAAAVDAAAPMDTDGLQLPSLNPIQAPRCGVFPASPATAGTKCLQGLLPQCGAHQRRQSWAGTADAPQVRFVRTPPRFSPRHHKAVGACILDRLHRWQEGERLGLWDSRPSRQIANGQHPSAEQRRALATSLAREGFDRKACAGVVSNGLCAPTAETMAALSGPGPGMTGSTVPPKKLPLSWTSAMRSTLFVVKPCCPP